MKKSFIPMTAVPMLVVLVALVFLSARRASAVPSFSREHGLKCSDCHAGFPLLNEFGMELSNGDSGCRTKMVSTPGSSRVCQSR